MAGARGRHVPAGVVVAAALAAASACSPAGSPGSGDAAAGELVVARTGDLDLLDPHRATAFQTVQSLGLVYDNLLRTDDDGVLRPDLATDWSFSDGGRTLTFTLRRGVTFHDGATFTAADAAASIERVLDEETGAVSASNLTAVEDVQTPDAHTLVLRLSRPDTALPHALTFVNTAMLDERDVGADTVDTEPNGTGPFRFGRWRQNRDLTLRAFDDYRGGAPDVNRVVFRVIPDESSILAGMRAGSFHLATLSDPAVAEQASGGDAELVKQPALAYHALMLNGRRPPLDRLPVRQAVACAVDRQQVVDTAANGDGTVTGPVTSPAFRYPATEGLPCSPPDPAAARRLLAEAGYGPEDPLTLTTIVMTGEYATSVAEAENLQAQLRDVGVRLELQQEQTNTYVERWLDADFDAAVALNGGSSSPYLMYARYFTEGGSLSKPAGYGSASLDALLRQGNRQPDRDAQHATFRRLQRELLRLSPWVWTFRGDDYYLVSPDVTGFDPDPEGSLDSLADVRLG